MSLFFKKKLGAEGEELAVKFLKKKGYKILERNFLCPTGEIDIIAKDGEAVVFVEVKTRTGGHLVRFGPPEAAVNRRKQHKIRKTALYFLLKLKKEPAARFDVISIVVGPSGTQIEHIMDAYC